MSAPLHHDAKPRRDRHQLSLKILLIVPLVTQVIAAVAITGWLSVQSSREATQDLAPLIGQEVSNNIETHVRGYFDTPLEILQSYGVNARSGNLALEDLDKLDNLFWQQMRQSRNLHFFYAANPQGQFIGVERRGENDLVLHRSLLLTPSLGQKDVGQKVVYRLDANGKVLNQIQSDIYDPRDRPWYQGAIRAKQAVWSPIYLFVASPILGITASVPIYGESGNLRGVLAIDLTLSQIGEFLRQLQISKTGQAFILEQSGEIVATSTSENPFINTSQGQKRIHALQSQNPLLRLAFQNLQKRYTNLADIPHHQQIQIEWEGATQYVQVTKLRNAQGLDWLLIVAVSEQDFRDQININTRNTIVLCALALVFAILTGFYTSKWIAKPVERLIEASHLLATLSASANLASGQPYHPIETANIRELSVLAESFNQMAQQLQTSFMMLARSKEELEERVAERTADLAEFVSLQRATFESVADGILVVDHVGRVTTYNQQFVDMFSLSLEILSITDYSLRLEFLAEQMVDPQEFMQRSHNFYCNSEMESYDLLELIDGRILERYSRPQKLADQIIGRVWSFQDITARIKAEHALKEQEAYLRLIIDSIPQQIFWKDVNLVFRGCNKNWAMYAQLDSPESVIGKTDYDLISNPEIADNFRKHDRQIMESNMPEMHLIQRKINPDKQGQSIWLDVSKLPIIDADGKTIGILGVLDDITQRKLAEEALFVEQEKSERLLLNILPKAIADRLKQAHGVIADSFESVTVLFADLVSFTRMSSELSPQDLVDLLNLIFSNFDTLCEIYGLEKIKTIGDAYMVAGGIPIARTNHAEAIAAMALDMVEKVNELRISTGRPLQIRIGIHTGAVIAGVIGTQKFIYDLWGDTVNVASRMESHSEVGKIQVTAETYQLLKHNFDLVERGTIEVKGKGQMLTYWLTGKKFT